MPQTLSHEIPTNAPPEDAVSSPQSQCSSPSNSKNPPSSSTVQQNTVELFSPQLHAICLLAIFQSKFVCRICNEVVIDCVCLECGHNFCTSCLHGWLSTRGEKCPTCGHGFGKDFQIQRTYCIDEFVSDMYEAVLAFSKSCFGEGNRCAHSLGTEKVIEDAKGMRSLKDSYIQGLIRSQAEAGLGKSWYANGVAASGYIATSPTYACRQGWLEGDSSEIMNFTSGGARESLKDMRRAHDAAKYPRRNKSDYSILEQQRELFSGDDTINLAAVVQFFLSAITAYITYEIGDSVDSDALLVTSISLILWSIIFMTVMRNLGYEGTIWDFLSALNFIRVTVAETDFQNDGSNLTSNTNENENPADNNGYTGSTIRSSLGSQNTGFRPTDSNDSHDRVSSDSSGALVAPPGYEMELDEFRRRYAMQLQLNTSEDATDEETGSGVFEHADDASAQSLFSFIF